MCGLSKWFFKDDDLPLVGFVIQSNIGPDGLCYFELWTKPCDSTMSKEEQLETIRQEVEIVRCYREGKGKIYEIVETISSKREIIVDYLVEKNKPFMSRHKSPVPIFRLAA